MAFLQQPFHFEFAVAAKIVGKNNYKVVKNVLQKEKRRSKLK